jgi:hypothetical protein
LRKPPEIRGLSAALCLSLLLLSGCSFYANDPARQEKEIEQKAEQVGKQIVKAKEEIPFTQIYWEGEQPQPKKKGGVYLYTKENHPIEIDSSFDWDKSVAVLVQINDPKYRGYEMDVQALKIVQPDVIKIVVKLIKGKETGNPKDVPAFRYLELDKDQVKPGLTRFIVETDNGQKPKLE